MKVEACDDGNVRPHARAHTTQQFAVGVIDVLGDHGAVQIETDGVKLPERAQIIEQHRRDPLVRIPRDVCGRRRGTPHQRRNGVAAGARLADEAGGGQVDSAHCIEQRRSAREARPRIGRFEIGEGRLHGRERIRLVPKAADCDAHGREHKPAPCSPSPAMRALND